MWVEMVAQYLFALRDLLGDTVLERCEGPKVSDLGVTLNLNEAAGDGPCLRIEVEESQVGSLEAHFLAEFVGTLLDRPVYSLSSISQTTSRVDEFNIHAKLEFL